MASNLNLQNVNIILFRMKFNKMKFWKEIVQLTYKDDFSLIIGSSSTYISKSQIKNNIYTLHVNWNFDLFSNFNIIYLSTCCISFDYRYSL